MPFSDLYIETGAVYYKPGPFHLTFFSGMAYRNPAWKCRGARPSWQTCTLLCWRLLSSLSLPSSCLSGLQPLPSGGTLPCSYQVMPMQTKVCKHFSNIHIWRGIHIFRGITGHLEVGITCFSFLSSVQWEMLANLPEVDGLCCPLFPSYPDLGTALIYQDTMFLLLLNLTSWETKIWVLSLWKWLTAGKKTSQEVYSSRIIPLNSSHSWSQEIISGNYIIQTKCGLKGKGQN